ncbi:hypothetical protein [Caulobacter sp.]|uniref:hypothetical protein n=1 Tax=Caulobacter sp. TaxID=78 RepID=UPI002B486DBB|nr:hypothetical protein [Caulobacter sp.]HJV42819.1 hypothetical protein [Caulobacter sp.]
MSFLAEMLAVAVVWLSSFALCQFGVATDSRAHAKAHGHPVKTVARTPRGAAIKPPPIPVAASRATPDEA